MNGAAGPGTLATHGAAPARQYSRAPARASQEKATCADSRPARGRNAAAGGRAREPANSRWQRGLLLCGLLFAGAATAEPLLGHWSSDCGSPGAEIDIHLYAVGESLWQAGIIQRVAEATGRVDAPPTRVAIKRRGDRVVLLAIEESIPPAAAVMLRAVRVDDDTLQLTGQRACTGEDCTTSYGRTVLKRCAEASG